MDFIPFIEYCLKHIKGDEKGEAQAFLDHFFMGLGFSDGYKAAIPFIRTARRKPYKRFTCDIG